MEIVPVMKAMSNENPEYPSLKETFEKSVNCTGQVVEVNARFGIKS